MDEHALCKAMEEKFNEIQATTKIPMLLDSVKMIHKKGLPLSEKAEAVKRGSKVFENTLNKIIPEKTVVGKRKGTIVEEKEHAIKS